MCMCTSSTLKTVDLIFIYSLWKNHSPESRIFILKRYFLLKGAEKYWDRKEGAFRQKKPEDREGQLSGWDLGKRCTRLKCFLSAWGSNQSNKQDFPGSPGVKTLHFHCRCSGSIPSPRTKLLMLEGWPKPKLNKHFWKTNHGQTLESVAAGGGVGMRVRCVHVCSVVSDFLWSYGLEPSRLLCPWDSPGKKNWSGLQFPTPEDLPDPRDQTCVSCMVGRFFTTEPGGKPMEGNRDEMPSDTVPTRMMLRLRSSQGYPGPWRTPDWQAPSVRWSGAFFLETYLAWTGSRRITVASFAQYGTKLLKDHSIVSISGYKCYLLKPLQEKDFTSMSSIINIHSSAT